MKVYKTGTLNLYPGSLIHPTMNSDTFLTKINPFIAKPKKIIFFFFKKFYSYR